MRFASLADPACVPCVAFSTISDYASDGLEHHGSIPSSGPCATCSANPTSSSRRKPEEARTKLEVLREEARAARAAPAGNRGRGRKPAGRHEAGRKGEGGARRPQVERAVGELHRRRHRGAGGPGAGPPPARHVRRRHRREGAAPPVRRGDRQRHGRGGRRPRQLDRGRAGGGRLSVGHRQRPRHPRRPASQVQVEVGAGSDHDHAALRRQVHLQGLQHLGRPARGRRLRRQRALREARGRGRRAASSSTP